MTHTHEDFCPFCAASSLTQKQLRWIECCQCFRTLRGQVTTKEAAKYLSRAPYYFRELVKSGQIRASIETHKNGQGFLYWIDVNDAIKAIRTPLH